MPIFYSITATIEVPDSLGSRSAAIAKTQTATDAFRAALEKQGFAVAITEKITSPKGPRAAKEPPPAASTEDAA